MDSGIQVAALIVIASFAIDRITGGTFFLLSLLSPWNSVFPDPDTVEDPADKLAAQKYLKLAYYTFVGLLAAIFVFTFKIGVLEALQLGAFTEYPWLDRVFTVLVLMGGSDQIAALLKSPHAGKALQTTSRSQPIEVTGKLTLESNAAPDAKRPRARSE